MITNKNSKLSDEFATSMKNSLLNKKSDKIVLASEKLIEDLNRSSELFEDLGNYKAAEIITKIIEKVAGK